MLALLAQAATQTVSGITANGILISGVVSVFGTIVTTFGAIILKKIVFDQQSNASYQAAQEVRLQTIERGRETDRLNHATEREAERLLHATEREIDRKEIAAQRLILAGYRNQQTYVRDHIRQLETIIRTLIGALPVDSPHKFIVIPPMPIISEDENVAFTDAPSVNP